MSDAFSLRPASANDLDALADIWHTGWAEAHAAFVPDALIAQRTRESFRIRLNNMVDTTTVATIETQVMGFCSTQHDEIYQIYVDPRGRGTGLAGALLADGESRLRDAGTTSAFLDVILENDRAIAFYRKQQWQEGSEEVALLETLGDPFALKLRRMRKML